MFIEKKKVSEKKVSEIRPGHFSSDTLKMNPKLLPSVQILLCLGAAVVYGQNKNLRMCIYWTSAAILTASVTF